MSIIYQSECVPYVKENDITNAIVSEYKLISTDTKCEPVFSPYAFFVIVTVDNKDNNITTYKISIGYIGFSDNITYYITYINNTWVLENIPPGVSIITNGSISTVTLASNNNSLYPISTTNSPFVVDDKYIINVDSICNDKKGISVVFERPLWSTEQITPYNSNNISNCENVKIPAIIIEGQTKIDGSDIGDMLFTIYDKYCYKKEVPLSDEQKICVPEYLPKEDLVITKLRVCSAKIVSVVKGKGVNLYCKVTNIWKVKQPKMFFTTLYKLIIKYAMLKYILSRLLYGNFDINYLLGKYNEKFLYDLAHSRFCAFYDLFVDCNSDIYGMGQYFKEGKICNKHHHKNHDENNDNHNDKHNNKHNDKHDNKYNDKHNDKHCNTHY